MRIDVDSIGLMPGYHPDKLSGDKSELNNSGELVRGRVIDVNQNMVLIQTSTGRQFSAQTTIPMENFIENEMSFSVLVSPDGEIILKPIIDEELNEKVADTRIDDTLMKLGMPLNKENKQIAEAMFKAGVPISKDNFNELKNTLRAANFINKENIPIFIDQSAADIPLEQLAKSVQIQKGFAEGSNTVSSKLLQGDVNIQDLIVLKKLGENFSLLNINSLKGIAKAITSKENDILGTKNIENLINDIVSDVLNSENNSKLVNNSSIDSSKNLVNTDKTILEQESMQANEKIDSELESILSSIDKEINKFEKAEKNVKLGFENNITAEVDTIKKDIALLKKVLVREISTNEKNEKEDFEIDYKKAETIFKDILLNLTKLGKEDDVDKLQKEIFSKMNILDNLQQKFNFNVIPFAINNKYENTLQYYVKKKNKKSSMKKNDVNIGLSLDTHNVGNVRAMINYSLENNLAVNLVLENKKFYNLFKNNIHRLTKVLDKLGFNKVNINVNLDTEKKEILKDAIYENQYLKNFETWV